MTYGGVDISETRNFSSVILTSLSAQNNHALSRFTYLQLPKLSQMSPEEQKPSCAIHALIDPTKTLSQFLGPDPSIGRSPTPTSQLVKTAVGVREVARQIGRASIKWHNPKTVMIITKAHDSKLIKYTRELAIWLIKTPRHGEGRGMIVYVDAKCENSKRFNYKGLLEEEPACKEHLKFWTPSICASNPHQFDFIISLGGDGTVLFTSWLFQTVVPPVFPFHLGSLGFLTHFDFDNYKKDLTAGMEEGVRINLRMRFTCTVYHLKKDPDSCVQHAAKQNLQTGQIWTKKIGDTCGQWECLERAWMRNQIQRNTDSNGDSQEGKEIPCYTTVPSETFEVLNELVVDRGPSAYMSMLELFGDDQHLTTVQADGLCISTPTGSTAYSLSAGGALTHPEIAAFLITPLCPHTLSFRPMLLPDSMELRICVPFTSRSTAWASFDGRGRLELKPGDHIKVTASKYPFPQICSTDPSTDWFASLTRCLKWNERQLQKPFVVIESHHGHDSKGSSSQQERHSSTSDNSSIFAMHKMDDESQENQSNNDDDSSDNENDGDEGLAGWNEEDIIAARLFSLEAPMFAKIGIESG